MPESSLRQMDLWEVQRCVKDDLCPEWRQCERASECMAQEVGPEARCLMEVLCDA